MVVKVGKIAVYHCIMTRMPRDVNARPKGVVRHSRQSFEPADDDVVRFLAYTCTSQTTAQWLRKAVARQP